MREKRIGIYCIENVVNNKKYIGQSIDIDSRWTGHRRELNKQEHNNNYLQSAWNKYGSDNFKFYVVKICDVEECKTVSNFCCKEHSDITGDSYQK